MEANGKAWEKISKSQTITRGIIQGENNSQMLFSLFINNLVSYIRFSKVILFADDVQIYIECDISAITNGIAIINNELTNIIQYGSDYGIKIHPSKTKAIIISSKHNLHRLKYDDLPRITIDNNKIEFVNEVRNLGYYLNRILSSETHIDTIRKKVYGSLNSIRPLKRLLPSAVKLQLVKTLIYPIIDYMDIIYHEFGVRVHGTLGDGDRLEKLLNCCIRYILNIKKQEHITPYRKQLNLLTLFERRMLHVASMIHKILNNNAPTYLQNIFTANQNNMRSTNKLLIQRPTTNHHMTSMYVGGPKLWNKIPNDIREINPNEKFVNAFREYLDNKK